MFGLEEVLANELKNLGAQDVIPLKRAVSFSGNQAMMYAANLHLRTALSILKPIAEFNATDPDLLYRKARDTNWSEHLHLDQTFSVSSAVNSKHFTHSKYVALKVKDAIVDQFRENGGKRPSVDTNEPDIKINVHIQEDACTLSLDSSGAPLFKRGYRKERQQAPLNEVLAAGMILLSGWDGSTDLIDPMCGSGTIPIEAAMIANNIPAGICRKHFGFQNWPDYNVDLYKSIQDRVNEKYAHANANINIYGYDISDEAIANANANLLNIPINNHVSFEQSSFEDLMPKNNGGILIINPPYGERLSEEDMIEFYKMIGDTLKQKYSGFDAWIISSNIHALKLIGLKASEKIRLFNGALECSYRKFEMYKGKKES